MFIPNAIFGAQSVMNISQINNRRLRIDVSVSYDDRARIEPICKALKESFKALPDVAPEMKLWVLLTGYGASSLDAIPDPHPDRWERWMRLLSFALAPQEEPWGRSGSRNRRRTPPVSAR